MALFRAIYQYPDGKVRGMTVGCKTEEDAKQFFTRLRPKGTVLLDIVIGGSRTGSAEEVAKQRRLPLIP